MNETASENQSENTLDLAEKTPTDGFRLLAEKYGPIDPADLPSDDPAVSVLLEKYDSWLEVQQQQVADAGGTVEAQLRMSLKVTPFYVEAGFTDPLYVDDVINDWMVQDLEQAENAGLDTVAELIRNKIVELENFLPQSL